MRRRCRHPILTTLAVAVAVAGGAASAAPESVCFTARDNDALKFELIQQAPPPIAGKPYRFYPLTGVASMQLASLDAADPGIALYYFQWANRSNAPLTNARGQLVARKGNFQQAAGRVRQQRTAFSSVPRADACTLAQAATALGLRADAARFAADGGIRLVSATAQEDAGASGPVDVCVVASGATPRRLTGLLLDYEVQDGRSAAETLAFLTRYATLVHRAGRQAILLTNPLDAPSQVYTGITAGNAHAIVDLFDRTTIFLWSRNRQGDLRASYDAQKAMIAAGGPFDGARILIDFELMGTRVDDARLVRRLVADDHLAGVLLWRNYAIQGGSCASDINMKIAAIAVGHPK